MNKAKKWLEKLNNVCLHKKVAFLSLALVLAILIFDCWFKTLPISGYALIFITLTLIGCTTWATCHGIKWLLHCNKPLKFYINEKRENAKFLKILRFLNEAEDSILDKLFEKNEYSPLNYPTTLNEQIRLFLKDTEREFVKPWYCEISQNPSFLFDTHLLLEEILFKIIEKLKLVNYKNVILNILILYLSHLQEYKKSMRKIARLESNQINISDKINENIKSDNCDETIEPKHKSVSLSDVYRFIHPGSQSDDIANYYLKKVTKWILQEYAPQEFVVSLQCKILTSIFARKVLKAGLLTFEDPVWIYIKLIKLLDSSKYDDLLQNKVYVVKERIIEDKNEAEAYQLKKPLVITKRYMKSNIFQETTSLFQRSDLNNEARLKNGKTDVLGQGKRMKPLEKESLNLSLQCNDRVEEKGHISSVLGGIISSTAGPLLPDNISVCYEPLNKMWQSPVTEKPRTFTDPIAVPLGKTIVEGMKIDSKHSSRSKRLSRSKSTDSMAAGGDANEPFKVRDVSIGEELCENVRFTSNEDVTVAQGEDDDPKLRSNRYSGNLKKLIKTRSFDSGTVAMDSMSMESNFDDEVANSTTANNGDSPKGQGDVSPVYEEPEDFATTIAKLRSLLQQRESSSTLSDRSGQSIDLHTSSTSQAELSDISNRTQSTDLENSSFDSQIAPELPTDGRPFLNVCIPKSEMMTDSHGSAYVLYSIQYDGIYKLKEPNNSEEPEFVLQTTVVKRRFQEFVILQERLEECSHLKSAMKGIKGPSKWLNLSFTGKTDETSGNRKQILENFIQQLCSKLEICAAPELHEFLAYGCTENKAFIKKDSESSIKRIDKLLTNKVTDVFNTIKTALPSFDFDSTNSISLNEGSKGSQDQKLLPGFLNFGNKTEEYELNFDYAYKESTGESLTDDIRRYFNEKIDSVENAVDVLDSNDWLSEKRECKPISSEGKCIWHGFKDVFDEDMDQLDSWLPVYSLILDIICELLEESDSWVIKEPVIRLIKVLTGHWESKIQERLFKLDWDQIVGNIIRLLRTIIFQSSMSPQPESIELEEEKTRSILNDVILSKMPSLVAQFLKSDEISSAVNLFVDSLMNFQSNRDVILRFYDILLVQLLSCRHLTSDLN